ncbi:MAG TPA: alkaline phosphatase family protein [Bryobacteraceae bacterium]
MKRRQLLSLSLALPSVRLSVRSRKRRVVVVMLDGFGLEYYDASPMPTLKQWAAEGVFARVQGQMPTVTNTNNASICCGVPASVHGITGNSYFNRETGREDFMEDASLLLAPTLFQKGAHKNLVAGLFTSKKKTASLLHAGTSLVVAAEKPSPDVVKRYGPAPGIYSAEINYWLWDVVIDQLARRKDLDVLYVHTTDYPMHMHPETSGESRAHLATIDSKLAEAAHAAPDVAFYLSADHGMNRKTHAWDLQKACSNRDVPVRLAISAERDKYPKHHMGLGGIAWIYLRRPVDERRVASVIEKLEGVEQVLTRDEAAKMFELMPERIGDLVVTGDRQTVFGALDQERETLANTYRSHGSRYELGVPVIIRDADRKLDASGYLRNFDLTAGLLGRPFQ